MLYNGKRPEPPMAELFAAESDEDYSQELSLPELSPEHYIENAYDEMELLGFPLVSPFAMTDWGEEAEKLKIKVLLDEVKSNGGSNLEEEERFGRIGPFVKKIPNGSKLIAEKAKTISI
jgi:hypothetical protein